METATLMPASPFGQLAFRGRRRHVEVMALTAYPADRPVSAAYGAAKDMVSFIACTLRPPCAPASDSVPKGDGHAVVVFPGFLTGDWATTHLIAWLRSIGYEAGGWGRGSNWGPSADAIGRCRALLDAAHERTGRRVTLIGRSLGGLYARELAKDDPGKVARVITLGTPVKFPVATPLSPFASALSHRFDAEFLKRAPRLPENPPVPVTAIHSRSDGIVPWAACVIEESPIAREYRGRKCAHDHGLEPQSDACDRRAARSARALTFVHLNRCSSLRRGDVNRGHSAAPIRPWTRRFAKASSCVPVGS